ncbi:MAG: peroxiredoxin [Candidatus Vesicomyosocius endoextente]|uniref:thioredoxin-dependent peroxiredoxin n=1 Tax=Candidatus Vesicomyosocius endoextente TaxID=2738853 RepID=A0A853G7A2_9GAMM|nr:peroxiredoxin [Candidatus Vesicomyosocius endoextente]
MNKVQAITCTATSNLKISIPDAKGRNIVLYFYPKDSTPGCTTEGQNFRDKHQAFLDTNTVIYGVSKDDLTKHEKFKAKQNFPFELIVDIKGTLCELFNVWQLKKFIGREYMGIVRSTFLIDANGNILKHWDKVKVKGHVEEVLIFTQAL